MQGNRTIVLAPFAGWRKCSLRLRVRFDLAVRP
jgi:hypothetical protein